MSNLNSARVLLDPASEELRFLPEGPYAIDNNRFSWVAIQHGANANFGSLNIFDLSNNTNQSFPLPGRPGFAFPTSMSNVFVVGCERSLGFYDANTGDWQVFEDQVDHDVENTIINDGLVHRSNLIFGTKDLEFKTQKAGLYLWRKKDRKLIRLRNDQICSNGKAVIEQVDGTVLLYDIDTPTKQVACYIIDIDEGTIGPRQVALDLSNLPFFPDGMTMTADQLSVIISFYNPSAAEYGETRQYRLSDGELEMTWTTPGSPQATCPRLISHDGKVRLVITTAVEHMPAEERSAAPNAGSIFIADTQFSQPSDAPKFRHFDI